MPCVCDGVSALPVENIWHGMHGLLDGLKAAQGVSAGVSGVVNCA